MNGVGHNNADIEGILRASWLCNTVQGEIQTETCRRARANANCQ